MKSKNKSGMLTNKIKELIISKSSNSEYIKFIEKLNPNQILDWHSINHGFEDITELDSIVIRGDILIERALRSLAGAIAKNPIPTEMSAAGIKNFIRLMEPLDQDYIKAMKILNIVRNKIAHEAHSDYSNNILEIMKIIGLSPSSNAALDLKASIIVIIASIANRREDLLESQ